MIYYLQKLHHDRKYVIDYIKMMEQRSLEAAFNPVNQAHCLDYMSLYLEAKARLDFDNIDINNLN